MKSIWRTEEGFFELKGSHDSFLVVFGQKAEQKSFLETDSYFNAEYSQATTNSDVFLGTSG